MNILRPALLLLLSLLLPACGKPKEPNEPAGPPGPIIIPKLVLEPIVPPGSSPPVGLIWNVGFTENVPLAAMEAQYLKFLQLSQDFWIMTEGQVCLSQIRFFDAVAPGVLASSSGALSVPDLDVVIFRPALWNIYPVMGQVRFSGPGMLSRTDRRIDIPEDAHRLTLVHEGSHFVWRLSWSGNNLPPALDDEYTYAPLDAACVMDLMFLPLRWCSGGSLPSPDHAPKNGGQGAVSCWEQIRKDYPAFTFGGISGTSSPLPPMAVEYNDAP